MSDDIIKVTDLVKTYKDGTKAVRSISFDVRRGEIFGLLGKNGAGKTTTLEIIESLRGKTSGKIIVDGLDLDTHADQIKGMIGIQLQSAGFYDKLKLTELLELFGVLYNTGRVDSKKLLAQVGLEDKANSFVNKLSGGQKQRFSFATTLVNSPKIIFLDEPTTGLDPEARRELWGLIRETRDNGTTIVLTTHYMEEASELCDRVAIMNDGVILANDKPTKLIDDLLATGFSKDTVVQQANLEDVFLHFAGTKLSN
jgi:ABC-2 type transport system ATP-binding protein